VKIEILEEAEQDLIEGFQFWKVANRVLDLIF
jgi:hypothetical protein